MELTKNEMATLIDVLDVSIADYEAMIIKSKCLENDLTISKLEAELHRLCRLQDKLIDEVKKGGINYE